MRAAVGAASTVNEAQTVLNGAGMLIVQSSMFFNYDCKSTRGGSKVSEAIDQLSIWLKLKLLLANEN